MLAGIGCKGNGNNEGVDTADVSVTDITDAEVVDTGQDLDTIDGVDVAGEEVTHPECTADRDCKDKFKDLDQCQLAKCNLDTGKCEKVDRPDGTKCDDHNLCTESEQCRAGKCTDGHNVCQCANNKDCIQFEDGNLCNGTLICDLTKYPHVCQVDPATIIKCDDSKDTFCQANTCAPKTGTCAFGPVHEGDACNAGTVCIKASKCTNGVCLATETLDCDDHDVCTDDSCNPLYGCVHTWNTADCDDGNACTESDKCKKGTCAGKPVNCDDGKFCNGAETCDKVKGCIAGPPPTCDDNNACDQDYCDPVLDKCVHPPLAGKIEGPMGDPTCTDGLDNDCDNLVDEADPDCSLSFVGLDPVTGPVDGGSLVTLSGTGLNIVTQVLLGGQSVDFQIIDNQTIQFTTPPHDPGAVDLEFGDGWAMVSNEGIFTYVKMAELPDVKVDVTAPDETPIVKGSALPVLSGTLTLPGPAPDGMVVQFGWGIQGTKPWVDPSWVWSDATVKLVSEGVYSLQSSMGTVPAGIFNLAVRVSMDTGASFAYGGMGTDVLGKYSEKATARIVVYDSPKAGDIFISELAWAGSSADGYDEWIELYNKSAVPLLMDGMSITHAGNEDKDFVLDDPIHTVNRHLIMPGEYAVIAEEDKDTSAINVEPAVVGNNTMFLRNNETVTYVLKGADGKPLDSAFFDGTFGGRYGTEYGEVAKTMERNKDFADGTKISSWHSAYGHRGWDNDPLQTLNWGTPGRPNSDIPECATDGECAKMFSGLGIARCKTPKCLSNGNCAIVNVKNDTPCDDGLFCTDGDLCKVGKCVSGPARDCSDDSICTLDSCNEEMNLCEHRPDPNAIEGPAGNANCSDNVDNDCDGKTDMDDPQCLLKVTAIKPDNGLFSGGTKITVNGNGFNIVKKLFIGKKSVDFTLVDDSNITADTPAGVVGDVDVSVSDDVVTSTLTAGFRYTGIAVAKLFRNVQSPQVTINVQVDTPTALIYGRVWGDDLPTAPQGVLAEVGYGPQNSHPDQDATWQWFPARYNTACTDCGIAFEFMGTLTISTPGTYLLAYRYSIDGGYNFLYATLGSGAFDPSTALKVVVSGN